MQSSGVCKTDTISLLYYPVLLYEDSHRNEVPSYWGPFEKVSFRNVGNIVIAEIKYYTLVFAELFLLSLNKDTFIRSQFSGDAVFTK